MAKVFWQRRHLFSSKSSAYFFFKRPLHTYTDVRVMNKDKYVKQTKEKKNAPKMRAVVIPEESEAWESFETLFALVLQFSRGLILTCLLLHLLVVGCSRWKSCSAESTTGVVEFLLCSWLLFHLERLLNI